MMTDCQMDIDWHIKRKLRFAPARNVFGVAFGIRGREFAAGIAGTGDQTVSYRASFDREAKCLYPRQRRLQFFRRHAGDQEILPDREADIAVAEFTRNVGESAHLCDVQVADRDDDPDPVEIILLLGVNADVSGPRKYRPRHDRSG